MNGGGPDLARRRRRRRRRRRQGTSQAGDINIRRVHGMMGIQSQLKVRARARWRGTAQSAVYMLLGFLAWACCRALCDRIVAAFLGPAHGTNDAMHGGA